MAGPFVLVLARALLLGRRLPDFRARSPSFFRCPAFVMGGSPITLPDGAPFLPVGRVREIVGWSGESVNGIQVVYDVEGDTVRGPKRMGDHGLYRQSKLVLDVEGGEVCHGLLFAGSERAAERVDAFCCTALIRRSTETRSRQRACRCCGIQNELGVESISGLQVGCGGRCIPAANTHVMRPSSCHKCAPFGVEHRVGLPLRFVSASVSDSA